MCSWLGNPLTAIDPSRGSSLGDPLDSSRSPACPPPVPRRRPTSVAGAARPPWLPSTSPMPGSRESLEPGELLGPALDGRPGRAHARLVTHEWP
jgi:hypothetical protein